MTPDLYVLMTSALADDFYTAFKVLSGHLQEKFSNGGTAVYGPAGFLAAQSAELYIKTFVIASDPSKKVYHEIVATFHDLPLLLKIATRYDESLKSLSDAVDRLNKFSDDRMRFAEPYFNGKAADISGLDDMNQLEIVRSEIKRRLENSMREQVA